MQEISFTESHNLLYGYRELVQKVNTIMHWARKYEIPVTFIQHTDKDTSDDKVKANQVGIFIKGCIE